MSIFSRSAAESADPQAVVAAQIIDDGLVHAVAAGADGLGGHGVAEAHNGHFGGSAADVADHAGGRLGDGQADADGRGAGLGHEPDLAGAGAVDAVEGRPLLDRRDAARHADQHARPQPPAGPLRLAEKISQHRLAQLEIGDHPAR